MSDSNYAYQGQDSGFVPVAIGSTLMAGMGYSGYKLLTDRENFTNKANKFFNKAFPSTGPINQYSGNSAREAQSMARRLAQSAGQSKIRLSDKQELVRFNNDRKIINSAAASKLIVPKDQIGPITKHAEFKGVKSIFASNLTISGASDIRNANGEQLGDLFENVIRNMEGFEGLTYSDTDAAIKHRGGSLTIPLAMAEKETGAMVNKHGARFYVMAPFHAPEVKDGKIVKSTVKDWNQMLVDVLKNENGELEEMASRHTGAKDLAASAVKGENKSVAKLQLILNDADVKTHLKNANSFKKLKMAIETLQGTNLYANATNYQELQRQASFFRLDPFAAKELDKSMPGAAPGNIKGSNAKLENRKLIYQGINELPSSEIYFKGRSGTTRVGDIVIDQSNEGPMKVFRGLLSGYGYIGSESQTSEGTAIAGATPHAPSGEALKGVHSLGYSTHGQGSRTVSDMIKIINPNISSSSNMQNAAKKYLASNVISNVNQDFGIGTYFKDFLQGPLSDSWHSDPNKKVGVVNILGKLDLSENSPEAFTFDSSMKELMHTDQPIQVSIEDMFRPISEEQLKNMAANASTKEEKLHLERTRTLMNQMELSVHNTDSGAKTVIRTNLWDIINGSTDDGLAAQKGVAEGKYYLKGNAHTALGVKKDAKRLYDLEGIGQFVESVGDTVSSKYGFTINGSELYSIMSQFGNVDSVKKNGLSLHMSIQSPINKFVMDSAVSRSSTSYADFYNSKRINAQSYLGGLSELEGMSTDSIRSSAGIKLFNKIPIERLAKGDTELTFVQKEAKSMMTLFQNLFLGDLEAAGQAGQQVTVIGEHANALRNLLGQAPSTSDINVSNLYNEGNLKFIHDYSNPTAYGTQLQQSFDLMAGIRHEYENTPTGSMTIDGTKGRIYRDQYAMSIERMKGKIDLSQMDSAFSSSGADRNSFILEELASRSGVAIPTIGSPEAIKLARQYGQLNIVQGLLPTESLQNQGMGTFNTLSISGRDISTSFMDAGSREMLSELIGRSTSDTVGLDFQRSLFTLGLSETEEGQSLFKHKALEYKNYLTTAFEGRPDDLEYIEDMFRPMTQNLSPDQQIEHAKRMAAGPNQKELVESIGAIREGSPEAMGSTFLSPKHNRFGYIYNKEGGWGMMPSAEGIGGITYLSKKNRNTVEGFMAPLVENIIVPSMNGGVRPSHISNLIPHVGGLYDYMNEAMKIKVPTATYAKNVYDPHLLHSVHSERLYNNSIGTEAANLTKNLIGMSVSVPFQDVKNTLEQELRDAVSYAKNSNGSVRDYFQTFHQEGNVLEDIFNGVTISEKEKSIRLKRLKKGGWAGTWGDKFGGQTIGGSETKTMSLDFLDQMIGADGDVSSLVRNIANKATANQVIRSTHLSGLIREAAGHMNSSTVNDELIDMSLKRINDFILHGSSSAPALNSMFGRDPMIFSKSMGMASTFVTKGGADDIKRISLGHIVETLTRADLDGDSIKNTLLYRKTTRDAYEKSIIRVQSIAAEVMSTFKNKSLNVLAGLNGRSMTMNPEGSVADIAQLVLGKGREDAALSATALKAFTGVQNMKAFAIKGYLADKIMNVKGNIPENELEKFWAWSMSAPSMLTEQKVIGSKHLEEMITKHLSTNETTLSSQIDDVFRTLDHATGEDLINIMRQSGGSVHPLVREKLATVGVYNSERFSSAQLLAETLDNFASNYGQIHQPDLLSAYNTLTNQSVDATHPEFAQLWEDTVKMQGANGEKTFRGGLKSFETNGISMPNSTVGLLYESNKRNNVKASTSYASALRGAVSDVREMHGIPGTTNESTIIASRSEDVNNALLKRLENVFPGNRTSEMLSGGLEGPARQGRSFIYADKLKKVMEPVMKMAKDHPKSFAGGVAAVGLAAMTMMNLLGGDSTPSHPSELPSVNNPTFSKKGPSFTTHMNNVVAETRYNNNSLLSTNNGYYSAVQQNGYNTTTTINDGHNPYLSDMMYHT